MKRILLFISILVLGAVSSNAQMRHYQIGGSGDSVRVPGILVNGAGVRYLTWLDTNGVKARLATQRWVDSVVSTLSSGGIASLNGLTVTSQTFSATGGGIAINSSSSVHTVRVKADSAIWNANKLQGFDLSATAPTTGQIMQYNGSVWRGWTPNYLTSEVDGSTTNEIQNLGIGTRTSTKFPLTISSGGGVDIDVFNDNDAGLVPASDGGDDKVIYSDGVWRNPNEVAGAAVNKMYTLSSFSGTITVPTGLSLFYIKVFPQGNAGSIDYPITSEYNSGTGALNLSSYGLANGDKVVIIGERQ